MRNHKGAHPRMGATDVCPLIPIAGITLEECAELARQLAKRIADELHVPTYCYEAAAFTPERRNLAVCRAGEYEALPEKMNHEGKSSRFRRPSLRRGRSTHGCHRRRCTRLPDRRELQPEHHFDASRQRHRVRRARKRGRPVREGNSPVGKPLKDENGKTIMKPGTLKATKAIGWFIDEYQIAQVSMNITNISVTPLHVAFDEVCRAANARGACDRYRDRRPDSEAHVDRGGPLFPEEAGAFDRYFRGGDHPYRHQVDGPGRVEAVQTGREGDRIPDRSGQ